MADFDISADKTLKREGGYQKEYKDSGNWTGGKVGLGELKGTNYGISAASWPHLDIVNLTESQAKGIYKDDYWRFDGIKDQAVADKLFDLAVNMGLSMSIRILKCASLYISMQIRIKPSSINATLNDDIVERVNSENPANLLAAIKEIARERYEDIVASHPEKEVFLDGWLKRLDL